LVCKAKEGVIVAFNFVTGEKTVHDSDISPAFTVPQSEFINDKRISKLTSCQHLPAKSLAYYCVVHGHYGSYNTEFCISMPNWPGSVQSARGKSGGVDQRIPSRWRAGGVTHKPAPQPARAAKFHRGINNIPGRPF